VDAETGGQILPCFALSGTYCRELATSGNDKPLFCWAFRHGTPLAGPLAVNG
jgi:hypothetical protein